VSAGGQAETPLADAVDAFLADPGITPFTTPGHKRVRGLGEGVLAHDLPLSAGADDLHLSFDLLGRAERLAAQLWGADLCLFCVNGSTQGNQALALAVARPGERVVVARNLHKSMLAGLVLAGLDPIWVRPEIDPGTGLALGVSASRVAAAFAGHPDAKAVFLVEPNFVGVLSAVPEIARLAHEAGAPLLVDQAWGAYLGFHPQLPAHSLALGADGFVTSAHKTLTGFTQSAYLLAVGDRLDLDRVREGFDALNTTSVAAAMLASLDRTRALLAGRGEELLAGALEVAAEARRRLAAIEGLALLGSPPHDGSDSSHDPLKLVLALPGTGADGLAVERDLFADGIRVELANRDTIVPLLTIADSTESVDRLCAALERSIERRRGEPRSPGAASAIWALEPEKAMSPRDAFFATRETVSTESAAGRVAAETIAPYPPGIPAIAPGEVIADALLEALRAAAAEGTRIAYCADPTLATVQVVAR
jgi:arginine decarboxylase